MPGRAIVSYPSTPTRTCPTSSTTTASTPRPSTRGVTTAFQGPTWPVTGYTRSSDPQRKRQATGGSQFEDARRLEAQLDQSRLDEKYGIVGPVVWRKVFREATDDTVAVTPGGVDHPIGRAVEVDAVDVVAPTICRSALARVVVRAVGRLATSRTRPVKWVVTCSG